jgi:hypothetical protein
MSFDTDKIKDSKGWITDSSAADYYNNTSHQSHQLYKEAKFEQAKVLVDELIEFAEFAQREIDPGKKIAMMTFPNNTIYGKIYSHAGEVYGELGDEDKALELYKKARYYQAHLKNRFENVSNLTVYLFRSFAGEGETDYNLDNMCHNQVSLSDPREMNDPMDSLYFIWLESPNLTKKSFHKKHLSALKKSFENFRIRSFCVDNIEREEYAVRNTLMWSHYAANHTGYCVEYSLDRSDFKKDTDDTITYLQPIIYRKSDVNLSESSSINSELAFHTKSDCWAYENEVRLISYKTDGKSESHVNYPLSDKSKIKAIYFGMKSNKEDIKSLMSELAKVHDDIKFYQMKIDYTNVYRLTFEQIQL